MSDAAALEAALAAALEAGEQTRIVDLYLEGAAVKTSEGDADASWFLLTHAYVHALEAGDARAPELRARLVAAGREA